MAQPSVVELAVPGQPEYLGFVRLVAAGLGNVAGFSAEEIEDLKLAVGEACSMGLQKNDSGPSRVRFLTDSRWLKVKVSRRLPPGSDPAQVLGEPAESLAFLLLHQLMDGVEYQVDSRNLRIGFEKRRPAPAEKVEKEG